MPIATGVVYKPTNYYTNVQILVVTQTILHDRSYIASECVCSYCSCYIKIQETHQGMR